MLVEDRLDLPDETETAWRTVDRFERLRPGGQSLAEPRDGWCGVLVFVAPYARRGLARLERHPTTHRLDHLTFLVERLEIDRRSRRHDETGRAVLMHGGRTEDSLDVPCALDGNRRARQRAAGRTVVEVAADARRTKLQSDHAQRLDGCAVHACQAGSAADVVQVDGGEFPAVIDQVRANSWRRVESRAVSVDCRRSRRRKPTARGARRSTSSRCRIAPHLPAEN